MAVAWYYVDGEARVGPVSPEEIARLIARGRITPQSYVWRQGLPGWEEAGAHFAFGGVPDALGRPAGMPPEMPGGKAGAGGMSPRAARYLRQHPQPAPMETQARAWSGSGAGAGAGAGAATAQTGPDGLYVGAPSRGFFGAIAACFRRYFGFSGRASRSEYWFFLLFTILLGLVAGFVDSALFGVPLADEDVGPVGAITSLAVIFPMLAVTWRRLHDIGRSGWWVGGFFLGMIASGFVTVALMGPLMLSPNPLGSAMLLMLLPGAAALIYAIVMLVFMCTRGDPGPNRYG